jgi:hypothetical protein
MIMEIRIGYHACKFASVLGALAFDSEDELLSYYVTVNKTSPTSCAVVFEDMPPDGDVYHLKYKIRISDRPFHTAQLFPEFLSSPVYYGKTANIFDKYVHHTAPTAQCGPNPLVL